MAVTVKFFIIPITVLINFYAVYADTDYIFREFGVTKDVSDNFLSLYKETFAKEHLSAYKIALTDEKVHEFFEKYMVQQFVNFTHYYTLVFFQLKQFIHFFILQKQKMFKVEDGPLYRQFVKIYADVLRAFYRSMTNMKLPESIEHNYFKTQIVFYYNLYISFGTSLDRPSKTLDEFIELLNIHGPNYIKKYKLSWNEVCRKIVNEEIVRRTSAYIPKQEQGGNDEAGPSRPITTDEALMNIFGPMEDLESGAPDHEMELLN